MKCLAVAVSEVTDSLTDKSDSNYYRFAYTDAKNHSLILPRDCFAERVFPVNALKEVQ